MNFEELRDLDDRIVEGYDVWVSNAPPKWKADRFLQDHSPIVVTSRFGQNSRIAVGGQEDQEAEAWNIERDYSRISYLTFALATSLKYAPFSPHLFISQFCLYPIRCSEIVTWTNIPVVRLKNKYQTKIYDSDDPRVRKRVDLDSYPLLDDEGLEIPVYANNGSLIPRRVAMVGPEPCGVLVDLSDIQSLFNPYSLTNPDDDDALYDDPNDRFPTPRVKAYPLGFLKTAGNIQADSVPHCFYPVISEIDRTVRRSHGSSQPYHSDNPDEDNSMVVDRDDRSLHPSIPSPPALQPVCSQFYNYIMHRAATRAGRLDAQKGLVTAAISGLYAKTRKDKATAQDKQMSCDAAFPSERFDLRVSIDECPRACRAELVYCVDVRRLKHRNGRYVSLTPYSLITSL